MSNAGDAYNKARDYAGKNPDKTRSTIDKVQDFVDSKTGGKHRDKIEKAGDFLEDKLGLPKNQNPAGPGQQAPGQPESGQPNPGQPEPPR